MQTPCRLIIDAAASGSWNMAVDELLLETAQESKQATIRIYQWSQPTLSLGYFQKESDRQMHSASHSCRCVRRQSGGGAILHDGELTYSLIVPISNRWSRAAEELFRDVHAALMELYAGWGAKGCALATTIENSPFLCFQRRAIGDILFRDEKITGSAQRRRRGAILQHGSILLRQSEWAPELSGLLDVLEDSRPPEPTTSDGQSVTRSPIADFRAPAVSRAVAETVAGALGLLLAERPLSVEESQKAAFVAERKFSNRDWTERR